MKPHDFHLVANDTDSISFRKPDGSPFSPQEQEQLIDEINSLMPDMIEYEHDGYYDTVLVVKAKNYVLKTEGEDKYTYKGSSIKDSKKEPALREFLDTMIEDLIENDGKDLLNIYHKYIREAMNIQDINRWAVKKSVSDKVLNPTRTNEQKVLDAIKHKNPREGDKFWLYSLIDGQKQKVAKGEPVFLKSGEPKMVDNTILRCIEDWQQDENKLHYVKRVYNTLTILENVIDLELFIKYHNTGNRSKLEDLCNSK